jgi:hypothetical protein
VIYCIPQREELQRFVTGEMVTGVAMREDRDMSSDTYQKTIKPSSSLKAESRSLIYLRMLLERMGFRIILLKSCYINRQ